MKRLTDKQRDRLRLAWTGFLQVIFVAMNTIFIARGVLAAMVATSFCISFLWSGNVKRIAFGDMVDRYTYAFGACIGCGTGALIARAITA